MCKVSFSIEREILLRVKCSSHALKQFYYCFISQKVLSIFEDTLLK
jgi:hypothetical protein